MRRKYVQPAPELCFQNSKGLMEIEENLFIYTDHALCRMLIRGITKEMVRTTLANPVQTGTGYKSRFLAY